MTSNHRRFAIGTAVCALAIVCVVRAVLAQDSLSGAWIMQSYRGGASVGPATGQLIFADGRFALIYRMTQEGEPPSGRAHAGTYTLNGSTLVFHLEWSMDYVSGKGSVADKAIERQVKAAMQGDRLVLTFDNRAEQIFTRARK